jgi:hypothetical protein
VFSEIVDARPMKIAADSCTVAPMIKSLAAPAALALALLFSTSANAADLSAITAEEFRAAAYFKEALEHPDIGKKARKAQIAAVAKDLKMTAKKLEAALDKVDSIGDTAEVAKKVEEVIREAAAGTRVKGHVLDVLVNAEEPKHVVLYVRWQTTNSKDVVKDAATIANLVAEKTPLISTLSLAAIHPKAAATSKDAVWSGKISSQSMAKIQKTRIDDYGDRLYRGLFEGVEEQKF